MELLLLDFGSLVQLAAISRALDNIIRLPLIFYSLSLVF